ncbi:MAG: hypothetical protein DRR00_24345 [Candidatus Parabeggiatoa sp. nov. 3]|nr:MAG: hypothetical protein DRR00_24345 [Gammaproteobacteria bacterium]
MLSRLILKPYNCILQNWAVLMPSYTMGAKKRPYYPAYCLLVQIVMILTNEPTIDNKLIFVKESLQF